MKLEDLVAKNQIKIDPDMYSFCETGLQIMRASKDPLHSINHIDRLISDLDEFLNETDIEDLNFNILLPAICWHDSWKAKRNTKNPLKLIMDNVTEGKEAEKLTKKVMKKLKIEKELQKSIGYCIRKHSWVQFRKLKSIEARILCDLDKLDMWASIRVEIAKNNKVVKFLLSKTKRLIRNAKIKKKYNLEWFQNKHNERYPEFVKKLEELS